MEICTEHNEEVCYESMDCPACDLDDEIKELEDKIKELGETIIDLENTIEAERSPKIDFPAQFKPKL